MARHRRRRLRLQLLAIAAAAASLILLLLLLLTVSPVGHATSPSTGDSLLATVAPDGAPRSADVVVHGPRRIAYNVPTNAEADAPTAASSSSSTADDGNPPASSSNGGGDPCANARPPPDEAGAAADAFLARIFGSALYFLAAFFALATVAILTVLLVKFGRLAAAHIADRCASAWRSLKEARNKATRVRPVDEDAGA